MENLIINELKETTGADYLYDQSSDEFQCEGRPKIQVVLKEELPSLFPDWDFDYIEENGYEDDTIFDLFINNKEFTCLEQV